MKSALLAITLLAATAQAQPPRKKVAVREKPVAVEKAVVVAPPAPPAKGITLPAGTVTIATTVETSHAITSVAPDMSVGLSDELTLAFVSSSSAVSGFRGSAGSGICVTEACDRKLADGGVELLFNTSRGRLATAFDLGVLATSIGPLNTDLKLGLKAKLSSRYAYLVSSPALALALDKRHGDQVWVPVGAFAKLGEHLALGVGSGIKGPLADLHSHWAIPLGGSVQVSPSKTFSVGASFVFSRVLAGRDVMDPGFDAYAIQVWTSVTAP